MTREEPTRGRARWLGAAGLLVVGIVFGAVFHSLWTAGQQPDAEEGMETEAHETHEAEEKGVVHLSPDAQKASGIEVVEAAIRSAAETLPLTGVVAPDQTRVAHIRPLARGVVKQVHVRPGDRVESGGMLITYDNMELGAVLGDYAGALAELESARSRAEVTETILARSEEMLKVGAVAQTTHELRAAEHREAQAREQRLLASVEKLEIELRRFGMSGEALEAFRAGGQQRLDPTASEAVLRAPFAGIVIGYEVAAGELIHPEDEVLSIADLSTVWVMANVYEKNLGAVRLGQPAEVESVSYPDQVFRGTVDYIGDVIDPQTRAAQVRCLVKNPQTRLKLEMFVTVAIATEASSTAVTVPRQALQEIDGANVVFVQTSETEFQTRPVVTGVQASDWVSVTDGLQAGERIVSQGSFALKSALLAESFAGEGHGH